MIAAFAYSKNMSPIDRLSGMQVIRHPPTQCLALCSFNSAFWDFDANNNYKPSLMFDGSVDRLDAIGTKFPNNIDTVFFNDNKPTAQFRYLLNDEQLSRLAAKGFWSENGAELPAAIVAAKFNLVTNVIVEEIVNKSPSEQYVPIFNIELIDPYENTFDIEAYDLIEYVVPGRPPENKVIENMVQFDVRQSMSEAVKAAEATIAEYDQTNQDSKMLTKDEIEVHKQAESIRKAVGEERLKREQERELGNAQAEAAREQEKLCIEAERKAINDANVDNAIVAPETDTLKLVSNRDSDNHISNNEIFAENKNRDKMPEKAAALLRQLNETSVPNGPKNDDNNGSGAASGAQGLGVYTFEDQSTEQFAMRADEGHGREMSEKMRKLSLSDDESETTFASKDDDKSK